MATWVDWKKAKKEDVKTILLYDNIWISFGGNTYHAYLELDEADEPRWFGDMSPDDTPNGEEWIPFASGEYWAPFEYPEPYQEEEN